MLSLFVLAALQSGAPSLSARIDPDGTVVVATAPHCREAARRHARNRALGEMPRNLADLPPGVPMHTVLKTVDGCAVNVLVRRGPDGRKVETPAGVAGVWKAPVARPSEAQRLPERQR
jgi:hypothetical protein